MKTRIQTLYLLLLLGAGILGSCRKVFDVDHPGGSLSDGALWGNPDFIKDYVNNFYTILPAFNRSASFSEETFSEGDNGNVLVSFLKGTLTSTSGYPDRVWDWSHVRSINTFFSNIGNSQSVLSSSDYQTLLGQAYFFRAYLYYRMVKVLGGVPIITTVQNPTADANTLMVKRNTTLECFNFIVSQLDSAISLLPVSWGSGDIGRVTRGAAMAVKGEVLLLKASPLFCKTANTQYWMDAYNGLSAAKSELDADGYGLYSDNTAKVTENLWYDKQGAAKEMVLYLRFHYPEKTNWTQQGQRPLSETSGEAGWCQPTWEMVKQYPMQNGKDITDPASGYDSTKFWKGRDPRFYNVVVYNGARYDFSDVKPRIQWLLSGLGGLDASTTGFYCRKQIDTTLGATAWNHQAFDWPIIRYAEILLNLAEAANESGHTADARQLIIQIRARAGIDAGAGDYGLNAGVGVDYATTLNAIMKERQIEFAYEGKRFWDLRRRRMFGVLNAYGTLHAYNPYLNRTNAYNMYGVDTTKNNSDIAAQLTSILVNPPSNFDRDAFLKNISVYLYTPIDYSANSTIQISDSYYFGPIDPQYILQNKNLEQTIGWDNGTFDPTIQ